MHHKFCHAHQTLRVTSATAAGLTDQIWEIEELVALVDAKSKPPLSAAS
jgi:hypothetical protein